MDAGGDRGESPPGRIFGGERPVTLQVPTDYDPTRPYPLVIALHGWGGNAGHVESLMGYARLVDESKILLAVPEGTTDDSGSLYWNATPACCGFGTQTDDLGYLAGLIEEIGGVYNVDPRRRYLIGHSNGGFMAYRIACDRTDLVAAVLSLAGATYFEEADCSPNDRVSVLQVHGDADSIVGYEGGQLVPGNDTTYPGAERTVKLWAGYNGCSATLQPPAEALDLDRLVPGEETDVHRFDGCPSGVGVELWRIRGGSHWPDFSSSRFVELSFKWLVAHSR